MGQRLNQNSTQKRRCDEITRNTNAENYKREAELLRDQLTAVKAKLAATNVELSRLQKDSKWRSVTIDQLAKTSGLDKKHCKRCNGTFDKPSLLRTHPCWPGHPPGDLPTRCNACRKSYSSHSSLLRHRKKCKSIDQPQGEITPRSGRQDPESVTPLDPAKHSELTPSSNDTTALSQQQVPTNPASAMMAKARPSPTHHIPIEQGQGEESIHSVLDQSSNCTADLFEASEDQGRAFFLDPFGMYRYRSTAYELYHSASFTEQSQLFTQNPFGNRLVPDDGGLQFSQGSFKN